ncbi:hypothetical protein [Type-E symbiont of Plautia stali]|uniref:hypothetical protein n=1 Tax=Type-E symbiont of Plautia stali TaxID=1560357 RepID=UPI00073E4B9E|nr:hypothetical protein [Type-E symbiont of Plautia stali]
MPQNYSAFNHAAAHDPQESRALRQRAGKLSDAELELEIIQERIEAGDREYPLEPGNWIYSSQKAVAEALIKWLQSDDGEYMTVCLVFRTIAFNANCRRRIKN